MASKQEWRLIAQQLHEVLTKCQVTGISNVREYSTALAAFMQATESERIQRTGMGETR